MAYTVVAVLRGGPSTEHEVSLKTGSSVLSSLSSDNLSSEYQGKDIFIDKNGVWHVRGVPTNPERALAGVDVVWNALHGVYGEDGEVQRVLERIRIPYTGSQVYASSVGINKLLTKKTVEPLGVRTPLSMTLAVSDALEKEILYAFRNFPQPSVVKPLNAGSSVGVSIAKNYFEFEKAIAHAFQFSTSVLIEEYIQGREATVGVVEHLRNESLYRLPPVEIIPPAGDSFFSYQAKYGVETVERCPGSFSPREVDELALFAETVHRGLGLRHYSRSDFIVSKRGVYFLEVNTLPGLTETSLLPKSLAAVGVSLPEFVNHVLKQTQGIRY